MATTGGVVISAPAILDVRYIFVFGNGQLLGSTNYKFIGPVSIDFQTCFTNGSVFFTQDGSTSTFASAYHDGPFTLARSVLLRAVTYSADFTQSGEAMPIYLTVTPIHTLNRISPSGGTVTASPPEGPYVSNTVVTLTSRPSNGWTFLFAGGGMLSCVRTE